MSSMNFKDVSSSSNLRNKMQNFQDRSFIFPVIYEENREEENQKLCNEETSKSKS